MIRPRVSLMNGRQRAEAGFSGLAMVAIVLILGLVGLIGWQVFSSQKSNGLKGTGGLVQVPVTDKSTAPKDEKTSPDGVPSGYKVYTNSPIGFSFVYPEAWGELQPVASPALPLNLATPKVQGYSLADALQVQATKKEEFRIQANDNGVIVAPTPNGAGFQWIVVDRGKDKARLNAPHTPQPSLVYQSGKARVYSFLNSTNNCTYTSWVFASQATFVKLRLPSFCISSKPGDSDLQAGQKADFEAVKNTILRSITVL